jgi:hypothetical protein
LSPKPGTGLDQYSSFTNLLTLVSPTWRIYDESRGHFEHCITSPATSSSDLPSVSSTQLTATYENTNRLFLRKL